jgi:hypothetical protein
MNRTFRLSLAVAVAVVVAVPAAGAASGALSGPTSGTAMPPLYKNCTNLNKKYAHGVGRAKAKDKSPKPVTTFKRSTTIYNLAISHNKGLDRDKDFVACEKA